jgi:Ankyrin repeats (many copies)
LSLTTKLQRFATHDATLVQYLLDLGANPNLGPAIGPGFGTVERYRFIPDSGAVIQAAARWGTIESLNLLMYYGAILSYGSPMHAAVEGDRLDSMARLLELDVDIDQYDNSRTMGWDFFGTPLLRAIRRGKVDCVKFLLDHGASTVAKPKYVKKHDIGDNAAEMVKRDWVCEEIRNLVEAVGETEGWVFVTGSSQ